MTQGHQSFTNQSSGNPEASNSETQLPRKSVASSPDTYRAANEESPLHGSLPIQNPIPANGSSSTPYLASHVQSSDRSLRSNGPTVSPQRPLGRSIRDSCFIPTPTDAETDTNLQSFLPRDKLEEILTEERIIQVLGTEAGFPPERQRDIARKIISPQDFDPKAQRHLRSRREILAILSLIEKVSTIEEFIDSNLFDYDLPFQYVSGPPSRDGDERPRVMKTCALEGEPREISIFYQWLDHEAESFENQQWKIHVPVFAGHPQNISKPTHYSLGHRAVTPLIFKKLVGRGGFSAVEKVEVHAAHVVRSDSPSRNKVFAIKRLEALEKCEFDREVSALNRFAEKDTPHLIQLLWTFSLGPKYHLVFPCAEGNLLELWKSKEFESPLATKDDHDAALWFSRQCLGIVEGLNMIHQCSSDHDTLNLRKHGRHGDLKPENILWFRDSRRNETGYSLGTLKISDFGMMGFHRTQSKYIDVDGIGCSRTYRAPECDIRRVVSPSYDIWCLACVLLEFTTWYLKGWGGVESFSQRRFEEDRNVPVKEDTFFNHVHGGNSAIAKESVAQEVQALYAHEKTSDFITDFVDFLEHHLLRMRPELRMKCGDAVAQFQDFFDRSSRSPKYCLELTNRHPLRTDSDLSRLEPIPLRRGSGPLSFELPGITEAITLGNETPSEMNGQGFQPSLNQPVGVGSSNDPILQNPSEGRWNKLKTSFCNFISCWS